MHAIGQHLSPSNVTGESKVYSPYTRYVLHIQYTGLVSLIFAVSASMEQNPYLERRWYQATSLGFFSLAQVTGPRRISGICGEPRSGKMWLNHQTSDNVVVAERWSKNCFSHAASGMLFPATSLTSSRPVWRQDQHVGQSWSSSTCSNICWGFSESVASIRTMDLNSNDGFFAKKVGSIVAIADFPLWSYMRAPADKIVAAEIVPGCG